MGSSPAIPTMAGKVRAVREAQRARTRELYQRGIGCRAVAKVLNENPVTTFRRLQRMGLIRDKTESYAAKHEVTDHLHAFQQAPGARNLRSAAIGEAVRWFLERGYNPSIPVETARYDLIVESDRGFQRVQVKSATTKSAYGNWNVRACRLQYDSAMSVTTAGKRRSVTYTENEIDYFFVVTADNTKYLIPLAVTTTSAGKLVLGKKYAKFKV